MPGSLPTASAVGAKCQDPFRVGRDPGLRSSARQNFTRRITARGSVDHVNVLLSIPSADEEIISTLRTWQFPLLLSPLCIIKEFRFEPRD